MTERRGPVVEQVSPMLLALLAWIGDSDERMTQLDGFVAGWRAHEAYVAAEQERLIRRAVDIPTARPRREP